MRNEDKKELKKKHSSEQSKEKLRLDFNSPVILTFAAICLMVQILSDLSDGETTYAFFCIYRGGFTDIFTYVRLFGHVVGHADWDHLLGNMTLLMVVGPALEERYGGLKIVRVILTTAIVTGVVHCIIFPDAGLLGASGVVFAFIILSSFVSMKEGRIPVTFIIVFMLWVGQQVYDMINVESEISNLTHILGGVVGAYYGYKFNKVKLEKEETSQAEE